MRDWSCNLDTRAHYETVGTEQPFPPFLIHTAKQLRTRNCNFETSLLNNVLLSVCLAMDAIAACVYIFSLQRTFVSI